LKLLYLSSGGKRQTSVSADAFRNLTKLEILYLRNCSLGDSLVLPSLRLLFLDDFAPDALNNLRSLEALIVDHSAATDTRAFAQLGNLRMLDIGGVPVEDLSSLSDLVNLQS